MKFSSVINREYFNNRFSDILKLKKEYHGELPLFDFGIGEDKSFPDYCIINEIIKNLRVSKNYKYTERGIDKLHNSIIKYLSERFDVCVDKDEVALTMGTKEGLSVIPSFMIEKGDIVISTKPGYVVLEKVASLFNAEIISVTLEEKNNFLPDFSFIDEETWKKVKIVSLNYPNNPTGAVATEEFYKHIISLAKKYGFLIVNDAAYLEFSYENKPLSLLSIEGAKEVAIELFTLSKSHNMTGCRIGFVAGNKDVIKQFIKFIDFYDSGQFAPIEYAASEALLKYEIIDKLKNKYYIRMENIVDILNENGLEAHMSPGTFYIYLKVPEHFDSASIFATKLLNEAGIMTIPYSENGEYVRLSMTFEADYILPFYLSLDKRLRDFMHKY